MCCMATAGHTHFPLVSSGERYGWPGGPIDLLSRHSAVGEGRAGS